MRPGVGAAILAALPFMTPQTGQAEATQASPRGLDGFVTVDKLNEPTDARLKQGRVIWGANCQNCHGGNKATGAPKITSQKAWQARIDKGMDVLIDHALNGFVGPRYTEMPPRGANPDLTDEQVGLAVAFMVWSSGGAVEATEFITKMKETNQ